MDRDKPIDTTSLGVKLRSRKVGYYLDFSGTIIDVTSSWLKVTGYKRDEVIGKHFVEFLNIESILKIQKKCPRLKDFNFINKWSLNIVRKDRVVITVTLTSTSKYTDEGVFDKTFCEMMLLCTK